ncbi:hypothetical protein AB205_0190180, partial [Aquarana catesbeiana]
MISSPDYNDNDVGAYLPEEDPGHSHADRSSNPSSDSFTHTGKKMFPCPHCEKYFKAKSSLDKHRTHTGKMTHTCTECGQSFLTKSELNVHRRCHMH